MEGLPKLLVVASVAAAASPAAGLAALRLKPTSLVLSLATGFAGGVLLGTFAFEMLPRALEDLGPWRSAALFLLGVALVYGLDMLASRGRSAGPEADQRRSVARYHRRRRPLGSDTTVLAAGTLAEELIEGLSIGVGVAVDPGLGLMVAAAIAVDNLAEGMSLAELIRAEAGGGGAARRVLIWTGAIGAALWLSAMGGWVLLRDMPPPVLGGLVALGAGGMFYLAVAQLLPEADRRQYQQSGALAVAVGFLTAMLLSTASG